MDTQIVAIVNWTGKLAELRDDTEGQHNERVQKYLRLLIDAAKVTHWDFESVLLGSVLHDIGKIKIPDSILLKPGRLTKREFEEMKNHCLYGKELIEDLQARLSRDFNLGPFLEHAKAMAYSHHEKWDGTGYPLGLKGDDIPLEARMMALADVYDVLVSKRPYKPSYPHDRALEMIVEGKGTHFDPALVDLFVKVVS